MFRQDDRDLVCMIGCVTIEATLMLGTTDFSRTTMTDHRRKRGKKKRPRTSRRASPETRASETLTVAWTVSVTGVLIADLMFVGAHFLVRSNPDVPALQLMEGILLLSAGSMGAVSLALLPLVWKFRRVKPPQGFVVFAVLVAAAPLAAILGKLLT